MKLKIFTDGGARGNPGPAAVAFVVYDGDGEKIIKKFFRKIGETTNNVAEYSAVIDALRWLEKNFSQEINVDFFLDSSLAVNQLNGLYKIKNSNLRFLVLNVKKLEGKINGKIFYHYVPREKNQLADSLVKTCLA